MKTKIIALAGVLTLAAGGALAQSAVPTWEEYWAQQRMYERQNDSYQDRRDDYDAQRRAYEARREQYLRDRAAYDARWGYGAYERRYGAWRWEPYPYAAGEYGYDVSAQVGYDPYRPYRDSPCERRRSGGAAAGLIIGALAGAAIGSNVAATDVQTEGAVLGAVVGGALGANIGRSAARCDDRGYYFTRAETIPYREARWDRDRYSGRYGYNAYARRGCRLAPAPAEYAGRVEYRYVRVCPDSRGRYRITP